MKGEHSMRKLLILLLILVNVSCDQWSKHVLEQRVAKGSYTELLGPSFILTHVTNTGAFLGLGQDWNIWTKRVFLHGLPLALLFYLVFRLLFQTEWKGWLVVGFSFILGGGIGNIIDRLRYGAVLDFFQLRLGPVHTGIFNLADVSVSLGIILVLMGYWFNPKVTAS
ncbi:MAG: signal peptidase [Bacteroidota bacterium]|jgi:signal peptidase II